MTDPLLYRVVKGISGALEFNKATLSGAIDIIVVEQPDGTLCSTPFHVRFGKLQLLRSREKLVTITVNNTPAPFQMKLGATGEAYFVEETQERPPPNLESSPVPSPTLSPASSDDEPQLLTIPSATLPYPVSDGEYDPNQSLPNWEWEWGQLPNKTNETNGGTGGGGSRIPRVTSRSRLSDRGYLSEDEPPLEYREDFKSYDHQSQFLLDYFEEEESKTRESEKSSWLFFWSRRNKQRNANITPTPSTVTDTTTAGTTDNAQNDPKQKESQTKTNAIATAAADIPTSIADVLAQEKSTTETHLIHENQRESEDSSSEGSNPRDDPVTTHSSRRIRRRSHRKRVKESVRYFECEMSLCGHQLHRQALETQDEHSHSVFDANVISYDQFSANPSLLFDDRLMVRFNSILMTWKTAAPMLMAHMVFERPLPAQVEAALVQQDTLPPLPSTPSTPPPASTVTQVADASKGRGWWFWKGKEMPAETKPTNATTPTPPSPVIPELAPSVQSTPPPTAVTSPVTTPSSSSPTVASATTSASISSPQSDTDSGNIYARKTMSPSSDMLKSLKLNPGANTVSFEVTSSLQGKQTVSSRIFLWRYTDKIVVSDVDGTITRSDVLGHLLPALGKDWSHVGVAQLFSKIKANGFQILYLTSRAIGQAHTTRAYLQSIHQNQITLPDGPCLMSPDSLLHAFTREVILRRPEVFKISCLLNVRRLFPADVNPFYAGFGNRDTDVISYTESGVPEGRIFVINPSGEISHFNRTYKQSYPKLFQIVEAMFPSILEGNQEQEGYHDFNFWKAPFAKVSDESSDEATDTKRKPSSRQASPAAPSLELSAPSTPQANNSSARIDSVNVEQ